MKITTSLRPSPQSSRHSWALFQALFYQYLFIAKYLLQTIPTAFLHAMPKYRRHYLQTGILEGSSNNITITEESSSIWWLAKLEWIWARNTMLQWWKRQWWWRNDGNDIDDDKVDVDATDKGDSSLLGRRSLMTRLEMATHVQSVIVYNTSGIQFVNCL